ncbi:MAG: glycosyltransferase family 2 protein [Clostridium sp.]|nr:glycosyltransferase family 2 protein [Clostridium sp.]
MTGTTSLPRLAIVIPCYNEEEALPHTAKALEELIDRMVGSALVAPSSYILCCDDGSRDATWEVIGRLHEKSPRVKGIALAHNRGHQYALLAGLMTARENCDIAVSIDADLQDDPEAIVAMVRKYLEGYEIVYGVRDNRDTDTWFKRTSAHAFYSLQKNMGLETVYDHADFRLMSSRALELLSHYNESNLFLRGIVPQIGLRTTTVGYTRNQRVAGESKYPLKKMLSFSIDGITSFSAKPIRIIFFLGLILLCLDLLTVIYVLLSYFGGETIAGWASLMLSVWFLGSLILMSIGVVGEYIGKIFVEVKHRPRYEIKDTLF